MSRFLRAKVDRNHPEIVDALREVGASVVSLAAVGGGVPDLAVGYRGRTFLLEVKHAREGRVLPGQADWHASWRGRPVDIVRSVEEALRAIGATEVIA